MTGLEEFAVRLAATGEVTLSVKVVPKSSRTEVVKLMENGTLKIKVTAPPEKGKANTALRKFLAREFGVPRANVTVESGHTSAWKRVKVVR